MITVSLTAPEWLQVLRVLRRQQDECRKVEPKTNVVLQLEEELEVVKMKIVRQTPKLV